MTEQRMSASRTVAEAVTMGPRSGPMGFGMGPVFAAGVAAAFLIPGLAFGAVATANTLAGEQQGSEEPGAPAAGDDEDHQDSTPGEAPGDDAGDDEGQSPGSDPDSDPDRGSDPDEDADQQDSADDPEGEDSETEEDEGYITEDVVHVVAEGDTLSGISGQYGVPMEIIAEHNGIADYNVIYIDAAILIPYSEVNVPVGWDD